MTLDKDGVLKVGCCRHCGNLNSSEELFDDLESLMDCIKGVAGFGESRRLAIGSLICSTFKPSNYYYVHSSGSIGYGVSIDHLRGMAGILQFQKHIGYVTVPYDREAILKAFHWLKKNNPLYEQFLAQLETLYAYFPTTTSGAGNPLPMKIGDIEIVSSKQLSAEDLGQCEGTIIEADPLAGVANAQVQGINDLTLLEYKGVQYNS